MSTKVCKRCSESKELAEFPKQSNGILGRHSQCKLCRAEYRRALNGVTKRLGRGMNEYTIEGDVAICSVSFRGEIRHFKVSASDISRLQAFGHRWQFDTNGYVACGGRTNYKAWRILLHRFLMGDPQGLEIDHVNRDRADNTRSNLEIVTRTQNVHRYMVASGKWEAPR